MSGGRPTKYQDDYPKQARRLTLLGLTDEEVATFFEVSVQTLYNWDEAHPEFLEARARGKEHADGRVVEKLYHRALGYSHPEVHITAFQGEVIQTPIMKHYPPDTQAASWWLKNRQPKKWKDQTQLNHANAAGDGDQTITYRWGDGSG